MFGKVLLCIFAVKVSSAVFIDSSENYKKDLVQAEPQGWQMVKVYHPPQAFGYKYEPYAYPKYEFEYSVSDKKTGDHKHHHEARDGDRVRGEYSLVESDGSLRKVQYHADDHSGFNAVVSKTINKHGEHAVSVSDHTRFFYPVGHNIKINHYFPGKDYHYEDIEKPVEISKPVHEEVSVVANKDIKMVVNESGDKLLAVEPMKFDEEIKESAPTEEAPTMKLVAETTPVELDNAVVSVIPNSDADIKVNPESINSMPLIQKFDVLPAMEMSSENEPKQDQNDSEVASSYYHSKFYYIIQ